MPRSRRPISARTVIVGAIVAVAALGLLVAGGVTFLAQRDRVIADVDERLISQVEALRQVADLDDVIEVDPDGDDGIEVIEPPAAPVEPTPSDGVIEEDAFATLREYLSAAVARLVPGRNEASVAVINGEVAYRTSGLSGFAIYDNPQVIEPAIAAAQTVEAGQAVIATAETNRGTVRYIAVPLQLAGDPDTGIYIRGIDLDAELEPVANSVRTFSLAAALMLAAMGVVGWFVAGRILSPIRHLRETADSITLNDLRARIPTGGIDDISDLSRTVNSMLDRLEGSVDGQRQLLDDVRHELKTPITIVRGHLEMMDVENPVDVAGTRDIGIAELDRMTRLVEDIDLLSSAEGDQFEIMPMDIGALTLRMSDLVLAIPGHSWELQRSARGFIDGDADRLLQAWLQLADNASKYTAEGTPIEIGSDIDGGYARLWVQDHGAGIPAAARRRIFRRFDRADQRRTVRGSGLGLAIVDAIAKAHQGTCIVSDSPGGGATFTIQIPMSQASGADFPAPVRAGDVVLQREATG